jgi:quercetin dioxygenase-like cupin family protein
MACSRREFVFLLPGLVATPLQTAADKKGVMATKAFRFEDLQMRESGPIRIYQIFIGTTHTGFMLDMHESELAAGQVPHAPHRHAHEELVLMREGTLEVTIAGKMTELGPGSGIYVASNEDHGYRNSGAVPAKYFVLALGQD